jgi:hypothetical protein
METNNQIIVVIEMLNLIAAITFGWLQIRISRAKISPAFPPTTKNERKMSHILGVFIKPPVILLVFSIADLYLLVRFATSTESITRLSVLLISLLSSFFIANLVLFVLSVVQRETIKTAKEGQSIIDKAREEMNRINMEFDSLHSQNDAFFRKLSSMTDKKQTK